MERLAKAARRRKVSKQKFVEEIVLAALDDIEEQQRSSRPQREGEPTSTKLPREPTGLGIAEALRQSTTPIDNDIVDEAPTNAPVVVNVGATGNGGEHVDAIEKLATYVTSGSDYERERRLRTAVAVLADNADTPEERRTLAARLDEAVARRTKKRDEGKGLARRTFDQIAELLKT